MRDLFRLLTDKDMHFPEHSVITKMTYIIGYDGKVESKKILFQRTGKMAVQLQNEIGTLIVNMIALRGEFAINRSIVSTDKADTNGTLTFTKEDILAFVDDVNDQNPIHRQEPYIVPGCLLLEVLYKQYKGESIKFLQPVLAGDTVHINKEVSKLTCIVGDVIVCEGFC